MSELREEFKQYIGVVWDEIKKPFRTLTYISWLESKLEKSPWKHVEDEEPPETEDNLLIWVDGEIKIVYWKCKDVWFDVNSCVTAYQKGDFAHWQRIQPPPKDKQ